MRGGSPQLTSFVSLLKPEGLVTATEKAHPAFKYAIVVAGIAALVGIVSKYGVSTPTLVFGVVLILFFMFVFLIFAVAARETDQQLGTVVLVVIWALAILFIVVLCLNLEKSISIQANPSPQSATDTAPQDSQIRVLTAEVEKL